MTFFQLYALYSVVAFFAIVSFIYVDFVATWRGRTRRTIWFHTAAVMFGALLILVSAILALLWPLVLGIGIGLLVKDWAKGDL